MWLRSGSKRLRHWSLAAPACRCALAIVVSGAFAPAAAAASIEARVEQAARKQLLEQAQDGGLRNAAVKITLLPREAVHDCPQDIEVEALDTRHLARMRFAALCKAAPPWRAEYIVRGAITADVVVTTTDLLAGRPIEAEQLAVERRDVAAGGDALSDPGQVVGKSSRRALRSAQIVQSRWLVEPILVKRGAAVNIVARNAGVEVQIDGEAMEAGRRGEVVRVRNKATGKIIQVRVVAENEVEPAKVPMSSSPQ